MAEIKVVGMQELNFGVGLQGVTFKLENGDFVNIIGHELLEIAETGEAKRTTGSRNTIYTPIPEMDVETGKYHIYSFDRLDGKLEGFEEDKSYVDKDWKHYIIKKYDEETELHHFTLMGGNGFQHVELSKEDLYELQLR